MRHLLLVVVVIVALYGAWHLVSPIERRHGIRLITRHAMRLGAVIGVAVALLAFAYYVPSTNLL